MSTALYDRGRELLPTLDAITLASFRDALGVGRRTAQLVLERFDADGLTLRRGDVRVLRRSRELRPLAAGGWKAVSTTSFSVGSGNGPRDEIALDQVAAELFQALVLLLGLDALGDDRQVEAV